MIGEVIVVTNGFGIHYLWIDALCILQDSIEDKNQQIGMMWEIYQNSYATIIAASGENVTKGFWHRDWPWTVPDLKIPFRCPDGKVGTVWITAESDTDSGDASQTYYNGMELVNNHRWCLQEWLLSPRCFIYALHTLQYYCQTKMVNIGQAVRNMVTNYPFYFHSYFYIYSLFLGNNICLEMVLQLFTNLHII